MRSRQQRSRARGAYGEARLIKKLGGVKVGLQKTIILDGKVVEIPPHKHPDILTSMFSVEVKYCEKESKMVMDAVAQAVHNCPSGFIPIAVTGKKYPIVHIRLEDWQDLHG